MKKGRRFDTGGDVVKEMRNTFSPRRFKQMIGMEKSDLDVARDTAGLPKSGPGSATSMAGKELKKLEDQGYDAKTGTTGFKAGGLMDKGVEKQLPTSKQMGNLNMKAGGMKESKAMVGKEVNFMKKKGAPASMVKHEAAEMGAMKKGGMAKYMTFSKTGKPAGMKPVSKMARGGGIESKGKTKGTIIKMAAGGLAGGHKSADGIAQRGKTKGMDVKMNKGGAC